MNSNYFYEYVDLLERILSFAHKNNYSTKLVEKKISNSDFFEKIEKEHNGSASIIDDVSLIREVFNDPNADLVFVPIYNQCMWAAESYLSIQGETKLTFEAIFLYIPIEKMYEYFPLYHEMDFSQIVDEFKKIYSSASILKILLSRYRYSVKCVSEKTGLNYDTLYSYKERRREASQQPDQMYKF